MINGHQFCDQTDDFLLPPFLPRIPICELETYFGENPLLLKRNGAHGQRRTLSETKEGKILSQDLPPAGKYAARLSRKLSL